ncbi:YggS family pyridoxal phosphate-dependent enzyme [Knoellia koreensis]|uniref:Pyridoxal phosphate homeostasis protein n=1 Tax=Knoellia koreensis TaxID=2730921 RepID=A0A849H6B5_9MICO|nr:YggS family pyridoxal phosphate-dependent enzyme [Knoellia sp. DB2414S]
MSSERRAELAANLEGVRERIGRACAAAGRDAGDVTLVAVTKFFPASDVDLLAELGVGAVGENRDQEASAKVLELAHRDDLEVHFVGQLQSKKAGSVAGYADVVQSLDRPKLVDALDRAAERHGRRLAVLVQVGLDESQGRGGVAPADALALADAAARADHLDLRGVMAVAPLGADAAPAFARLREVARGIQDRHPQATWISAGMSGDLEQAIAHGATHLRVGTAILGSRQSHQ